METSLAGRRTPTVRAAIGAAIGTAVAVGAQLAHASEVAPAATAAAAACAGIGDDRERLACYDLQFRRPAPAAGDEATPLPPPQPYAPAVEAPLETRTASAMSRYWELDPQDKQGFRLKPYQANYFLPLHRSNRSNDAPSSPTHLATEGGDGYERTEAKIQISLRTKLAEDLGLPDADLWFGYTQLSLWQIYNRGKSSPFRNSDYQPELIYVVPVAPRWRALPLGWQWRMLQLGFAHQSNGQGDELSRSWNRAYFGAGFEHGDLGVQVRANARFGEKRSDDDNPDLTHYIGHGEVRANWLPGRSITALTWRGDPTHLHRGSLQFDWSYPVDLDQPAGLRWYLQLFTGYGESLIDYNVSKTSIGVGFSLFDF